MDSFLPPCKGITPDRCEVYRYAMTPWFSALSLSLGMVHACVSSLAPKCFSQWHVPRHDIAHLNEVLHPNVLSEFAGRWIHSCLLTKGSTPCHCTGLLRSRVGSGNTNPGWLEQTAAFVFPRINTRIRVRGMHSSSPVCRALSSECGGCSRLTGRAFGTKGASDAVVANSLGVVLPVRPLSLRKK